MNITFLFGSGADTDCCKDMPSGGEFSRILISDSYKDARNKLLGKNSSQCKVLHHNSTKIYFQTIYEKREAAKEAFEEDIKCYVDAYQNNETKNYSNKAKDWYKLLEKENIQDEAEEKIKNFFLENAVFFDTLDGRFNSLRHYDDSKIANQVKTAYTIVFWAMLKSLYSDIDKDAKKAYGIDMNEGFAAIFELLLKSAPDCKCDDAKDTVYKQLSEFLKSSDNKNFVATTNYTDLICQDMSCSDIIYLHGKLTWFEDLRKLTVYDITTDERTEAEEAAKRNELIPFILITSGVKPLICTKQIREFSKFITCLEESDELCILGYRFNNEDNHINAIISDWLRKEKHRKLICFNFDKKTDFSSMKWTTEIEVERYCEDDDSNEFENSELLLESCLKSDAQIIDIETNKHNSRNLFGKYLKMRQNRSN